MNAMKTFREWRRGRPFVGSLLLVVAGVEMFFSTQLDLGNMHIQLGVEGFQATVIPIGFVLLGVLIALMPQHRIFYGVIALALSLYSIIGVNLGGFIIGMLLSAVGGILAVSWAPAPADAEASSAAEGSGETVGDAASPDSLEPVPADSGHERELVGAVAASSGHADGVVHAEFVPYPSLAARNRQAKADDTHAAPPPFSTAAQTGVSGSAPERKAPRSGSEQGTKKGTNKSGSTKGAAAAAALVFLAAVTGIGAVAAPSSASAEPSALCLPILMTCSTPSPSPSPSSSSGGGLGGAVGGLVGGLVGGAAKAVPGAAAPAAPLVIGPDAGAYPMTLPAGQLGGSSISIGGIRQVGLVTVKKLDGTSFPVIKLVADDVTITGFLLDVRRSTGPSLVSTADRMELKGNVSVWLDSLTGTTLGGLGLTLGTDQTPPPGNELPSQLLRINLGLVATSANSITYSNLHQALHE
ncbi:MAG TPA: DUF6114 domain-containing protein [Pseudolysinimonas sp.]|jgi:hypothetical protein